MINDDLKKLVCYKKFPIWNSLTIPEAFKVNHNTKSGIWAKLEIFSGSLTLELLSSQGDVIKCDVYNIINQPNFIEPKQNHRIAQCSKDLRCQLSLYRSLQDENIKN